MSKLDTLVPAFNILCLGFLPSFLVVIGVTGDLMLSILTGMSVAGVLVGLLLLINRD